MIRFINDENDENDELYAVCEDRKHIVKVNGRLYGIIEGNDIISPNGDFIGSFTKDRCVVNEDGDMLFYLE